MAATQVSICNIALKLVGARSITAIDDGSEEANVCSTLYDPTLQELLRSNLWRFARKRDSITVDGTAPTWGYDSRFAKPADCLQVWAVGTGGLHSRGIRWTVEGQWILANTAGPLDVLYAEDVTDPALFDVLFVMVFAHQLAVYICEPLTQSTQKKQNLEVELGRSYSQAVASDAVESLELFVSDGDWILNRALSGGTTDPTLIWDQY